LDGFGYVGGATLQEAADELVRRMLVVAMAFRASGVGSAYSECRADPGALDLISKLGDVAAAGGDIRDYLFGPGVPG
jgi:cytosine/adenosine deaminase-related metal-dependent hydrolase